MRLTALNSRSHRHRLLAPLARTDKQRRIRLGAWHRHLLELTTLALSGTGLAWIILHYFFSVHTAWGVTPSPWEAIVLSGHGASMQLFLLLWGSLFSNHINLGLRQSRNRITGWCLLCLLATLTLSGWMLYYLSNEELRPLVSLLHWGSGLLVVPLFFWHPYQKKIKRQSKD